MATIVIVGGGVWAKGADLATAKKGFTSHNGRLINGYGVYTFDDATVFHGIDDFGRYSYTGNAPTLDVVESRRKARAFR